MVRPGKPFAERALPNEESLAQLYRKNKAKLDKKKDKVARRDAKLKEIPGFISKNLTLQKELSDKVAKSEPAKKFVEQHDKIKDNEHFLLAQEYIRVRDTLVNLETKLAQTQAAQVKAKEDLKKEEDYHNVLKARLEADPLASKAYNASVAQ